MRRHPWPPWASWLTAWLPGRPLAPLRCQPQNPCDPPGPLDPDRRRQPERSPGRLPPVVLYTRRGCHLCDQALAVLQQHGMTATLVDIDRDPALAERYGCCVPVVEIDGRVRFRGRVNEVLLVRLLRGWQQADRTRQTPHEAEGAARASGASPDSGLG